MNRKLVLAALAIFAVALILTFRNTSSVRAAQEDRNKRILIVGPIDENNLVSLGGNTRPEANAANDRGPVNDGFPMEHMLLQLKRAPEQETALEEYISGLTDKSSPNYHHWLTPAQLGETYGPSRVDIERVTAWLESYGFTVNYTYPSGVVTDFSGTAGQIRDAFHTEIHYLDVHGKTHYANMSDPQIPAALAEVVVGVVSMHNFMPRSMAVPRTNFTFSGCGSTCYALVPGDIETIYNFNPLFAQNILGLGQTIAVVEDSDTYSNDPEIYRSTFLSRYSGTQTTTHPNSGGNCTDPKTNAADGEADLDVEIAAAAAPDATIEVAACADTATFGGLIAVENLVSAGSPPAIISMSYGECEVVNGATSNAAFSSAFQSAAASGVSVFVSAGDSGASSCAPDFFAGASTWAYPGIGVTGWGESVYNVSVGGTDYEDTYNAAEGGASVSTYWESTNTPVSGSAKSYTPEIPWNDSCASWLVTHLEGYTNDLRYDRLLQQHHGYEERRVSLNGCGKRRSERLRHRYVGQSWPGSRQRNLRRIRKAVMAGRDLRQSRRRCARRSRRIAVCRQRHLGTLRCRLFLGHRNWRCLLQRRPEHLGRLWRHLRRHSHDGRHSGPCESKDGFQARQSRPDLLSDR